MSITLASYTNTQIKSYIKNMVYTFFPDFHDTLKNKTEIYGDEGFIYLVESVEENRYKIGRTKNLTKRLSELKVGSSSPLTIKDYFWSWDYVRHEAQLHNLFRFSRYHGEWFNLIDCEKERAKEKKRIQTNKWEYTHSDFELFHYDLFINPVIRNLSIGVRDYLKNVLQTDYSLPDTELQNVGLSKSRSQFEYTLKSFIDSLPE